MQGSGCVAGLDPSPLSSGAEAGAPCGPESCTGGGGSDLPRWGWGVVTSRAGLSCGIQGHLRHGLWPLSEVSVFSFTPRRSLPHQQSWATCDEHDR